MGLASQRKHLIKKSGSHGDDFLTTCGVEAGAFLTAVIFRNQVRPVEGVVQAAPAGIGRIEGETRIADRHHQLRAGDRGNFRVNIAGVDREIFPLRHKITDLI